MKVNFVKYLIIFLAFSTNLWAEDIILPAGEKLKLNKNWQSYTSEKVLEKLSPYPLIENKVHKGVLGVLNTEVRFFNPKKDKNMKAWFEGECLKLKNLYPNGDVSFVSKKEACRVDVPSTKNKKGMVQFLKAKEMKKSGSNLKKVFVYSYNFYFPKQENAKNKLLKDEVDSLMKMNL